MNGIRQGSQVLQQAKETTPEHEREVTQGRGTRSVAPVPTFREATRATIEQLRQIWDPDGGTEKQWNASFEKHVLPALGELPVDAVRATDVLRVLEPIWRNRQVTAIRIRNRIRRILGWCQAHGYLEQNVADARLGAALPPLRTMTTHFRALPHEAIPEAIVAVNASNAPPAVKLCLQFLILTVATSAEARGAEWSEILPEQRLWDVPHNRRKSRLAHRQPLSEPAMAVLQEARALDDGSGLVFPSTRRFGQPIKSSMLMDTLRSVGLAERTTVIGLRSSFNDWAIVSADADYAVTQLTLGRREDAQSCLAFCRSERVAQRRILLDRWGAFVCSGESSTVNNRLDTERR